MAASLETLASAIVVTASPETTAALAAQLMRQHHVGALVVVDARPPAVHRQHARSIRRALPQQVRGDQHRVVGHEQAAQPRRPHAALDELEVIAGRRGAVARGAVGEVTEAGVATSV